MSGDSRDKSVCHTEDLDEQMNSFQIRQFIVIGIYAQAEEKACISSIHDLVVPELDRGPHSTQGPNDGTASQETHLDEVGLVFLIPGGYKAMYLTA